MGIHEGIDYAKLARQLPKGPCGSVEETIDSMYNVGRGGLEAGLPQIWNFAGINYRNVTVWLRNAINAGLADTPDELSQAIPNFDWLLDENLKALCEGEKKDIRRYWHPFLLDPRARDAHRSIQVASGMFAHVWGDLPVLGGVSSFSKRYLNNDYDLLVDPAIGETAHEEAAESILLRRPVRVIMTNGMVRVIVQGRKYAKAQGEALSRDAPEDILTGGYDFPQKVARLRADPNCQPRLKAIEDRAYLIANNLIKYGTRPLERAETLPWLGTRALQLDVE